MWLSLNDAFLSFVSKDCARDEVLVRARRKGDIEKIFPKAKVTRYTKSDYLYRAAVKRDEVKKALAGEVDRVTYDNFKSSVADIPSWRARLLRLPAALRYGSSRLRERVPTCLLRDDVSHASPANASMAPSEKGTGARSMRARSLDWSAPRQSRMSPARDFRVYRT